MFDGNAVINWLLEGDPAIRWQAQRDLLRTPRSVWEAERQRVAEEGWGATLLGLQQPSGMWAGGLYSPKWTSTTYTLLLLRRMGLPAGHPAAPKPCRLLLDRIWHDGGINISVTLNRSETCVTGMVLSLASHFEIDDPRSETLVEHLLGQQMADGGWNCQRWRGATHGSFHTTLNVLEGLRAYAEAGGAQTAGVLEAEARAREFLVMHRLYRSHRTGEVVDPAMTRFSFPPRWRHDVLRALDYFQAASAPRDERLADPIDLVMRKRRKDGRWPLQNRHSGRTYFEMEKPGQPSRWNTLRALRVLAWWEGG